MRRRLIGFGSIGDFNAIVSGDQSAAAAWQQVEAQLNAESAAGLFPPGASGTALNAAKQSFADAYAGLVNSHADLTQIVPAAQQYAAQAWTVIGSVQNVVGFIAAANNPATPPADLVNSFTGIIVGVVVAAGAASAGVGAAVVGAVALAVDALQSAGFFPPSRPPGQGIAGCDNSINVPAAPNGHVVVIGCCVGVYASPFDAQIPGPQDNRWRSFPDPARDGDWFVIIQQGGATQGPISWGRGTWESGTNGPRKIDACFPQYRHLECEAAMKSTFSGFPSAASAFAQAYFQAWKLNNTLLFNGQKAADDVTVLKQLMSTWNLAHVSAGAGDYTFAPVSAYMPSPGPHACSDVVNYGSYVQYLASSLGAPLTIHTGALKQPPQVMALSNNVVSSTKSALVATVLATGGVVGAAAIVGVGVFSVARGERFLDVWQRLWSAVERRFHR